MATEWSKKDKRKYDHIEASVEDRGGSTKKAKEIAARTVNKDRAQQGRSEEASASSVNDVSASHRGGKRSGNGLGPGGPTRDQLYNEAKQRGVDGRSTMTKQQLKEALGK